MNSIVKYRRTLPRSSVLSKTNGKYRLSRPSDSSFRLLVKRAGLRSSYDLAMEESELNELIQDALDDAGRGACFLNAMTRHGFGGYSCPEPNRVAFRTSAGGVLIIDVRTGSVWLQGSNAGQAEIETALESLVGRAL